MGYNLEAVIIIQLYLVLNGKAKHNKPGINALEQDYVIIKQKWVGNNDLKVNRSVAGADI